MKNPPIEEHLARTFEIFKSMTNVADIVMITDGVGMMRIQRNGYHITLEAAGHTTPEYDLPFGVLWRTPKQMLDTMHFAIYAMNRAALKPKVVTVVVADNENDTDSGIAVNVYKGSLEDGIAMQRAARDLAKEFGEGMTTESVLQEWTMEVFSLEVA